MISLCALLVVSLGAAAPGTASARERADAEAARLKQDILNTNKAIEETERLIAVSSDAIYLPDLNLRLAELYVEKSRYVFRLQAQLRPAGQKGAIASTETRLLKQKAIQIYDRILSEEPTFKQTDKVLFYLAHEQRELGQFPEMLKTLKELTQKCPTSPLRLEAEQIFGDYYFDKSENDEAEKHYQAILEAPPSPVHDLARYKLGWIRVNQSKHAEAVTFFEAAAASPVLPGTDPLKSLSVKREALLDLVYSYTEAKPGKGALAYFERLSDSPVTYAMVLEKLGNRYFLKQQYELAVPAYRKLLELQVDPRMDVERVERLDDALRLGKGKILAGPQDVRFIARAAEEVMADTDKPAPARAKVLAELEEMARDLSTRLHLAAKDKDDDDLFADAAAAYSAYLTAFGRAKQARELRSNRAEALFAAKDYTAAGRAYEALAKEMAAHASKEHERLLYGALLSFNTALQKQGEQLRPFAKTDARQALKLLGNDYLAKYAKSDHARGVAFNIARAHYDDGEFLEAAKRFTAFAIANPDHKDAPTAGHLALDALRHRNDFEALERVGKQLLAAKLPEKFQGEVKTILASARGQQLDELALQGAKETGDVVAGLTKLAAENKGLELGEEALYGALTAAREARDWPKERALATQFLNEYPKSALGAEILVALGRGALDGARFTDAAALFEQAGQRLEKHPAAVGAWQSAANVRTGLGELGEAARDLQRAVELGGGQKAELLAQLAELYAKAGEGERARTAAGQALALDSANGRAAAVLAQLEVQSGGTEAPPELMRALVSAAQGQGSAGPALAKGFWYAAELQYQAFRRAPGEDVERKAAQLQQLEGLYVQTASLGSPEWAVASLWRLGLAYGFLADTLKKTQPPGGLSAAESEQWRKALAQQAEALSARADETLKTCVSRANELGVYSAGALGCRTREESAQPKLPPAPQGGPKVDEARAQQAYGAQDASALTGLGLAYLAAGKVPLAQLTLSKAVELGNSGQAQNALGVATLLLGDATGAYAAYEKALDGPSRDKARVNVAALKCRFGDKDGARQALAQVKDPQSLEGPDLDRGWTACR